MRQVKKKIQTMGNGKDLEVLWQFFGFRSSSFIKLLWVQEFPNVDIAKIALDFWCNLRRGKVKPPGTGCFNVLFSGHLGSWRRRRKKGARSGCGGLAGFGGAHLKLFVKQTIWQCNIRQKKKPTHLANRESSFFGFSSFCCRMIDQLNLRQSWPLLLPKRVLAEKE